MRQIFTIAFKDLKLLWRDKAGLFWVLAFPLIMATFFGSVFSSGGGGTGSMRVVVVDEDQTELSQRFMARLSESESLLIDAQEFAAAKDAVRKGDRVAYIRLLEGFGDEAGPLFSEQATLEVGMDPARKAEAGYLQGLLMEKQFQSMVDRFKEPTKFVPTIRESREELQADAELPLSQKLLISTFLMSLEIFLEGVEPELMEEGGPSLDPSTMLQIVEVAKDDTGQLINAFEVSFPQAMLWGVLGCAAAFAISMVIERTRGTLLRVRVAPLSHSKLLAGKAMACFLACVGTLVLLLAVASLPPFRVRIDHVVQLVVAVVATSICFVGLMMFISVLGKTEQSVAGAGWGILLIMSMLGGGMIPLIAMPQWMQQLSHISPVKWAILSLEGAIWRGFSPAEMVKPCGILVAVGCGAFVLGTALLRRADG